MRDTAAIETTIRQIADEVLFPAAAAVDAVDQVPVSHLDLLAGAGLYGLFGPAEFGGIAAAFSTACRLIETLAGGCLSTTFVWLQHHGAVRAVAGSRDDRLRAEWLEPLCSGERRVGVALAGVWPGAPLRARPVPGGYLLNGVSPWVTGWGLVDTLFVAARADNDLIVWSLADARSSRQLTVDPLTLVATTASRTVRVSFTDYFVPAERIVGTEPHADWAVRDAAGLRLNGSLALGVIARCCMLLGPGPLDEELDSCRTALDEATPQTMPDARAAASELAMRATAALVVTQGSRSILADRHAQRLAREALFLLVFGSRPGIRESLSRRLIHLSR